MGLGDGVLYISGFEFCIWVSVVTEVVSYYWDFSVGVVLVSIFECEISPR